MEPSLGAFKRDRAGKSVEPKIFVCARKLSRADYSSSGMGVVFVIVVVECASPSW